MAISDSPALSRKSADLSFVLKQDLKKKEKADFLYFSNDSSKSALFGCRGGPQGQRIRRQLGSSGVRGRVTSAQRNLRCSADRAGEFFASAG